MDETNVRWRVIRMKARGVALLALVMIGLLSLPQVVSAQEVSLLGTVVRVDAGQGTIWIQEYGPAGAARVWAVRTANLAQPGGPGIGIRVGDVVEVRGVIIGTNQLLARSLVVRSQGVGSGPGTGSGPNVGPRPAPGGGPSPYPGITPRGQRIEIDGVIIAMDSSGQGLLQIQDRLPSRGNVVWTVRVTGRTRVDGQRGDRRWNDDDDDDNDRSGIRAARRLLHVGDVVEVEGRVVGNNQILAEEITVRGRTRYLPGTGGPYPYPQYPYPQPAPYPPYAWQTVIFSPQPGTDVSGSEFTVVGRTMPGAQVQIHVMARWSVFQVQVANTTVAADQNGMFVLQIRPSMRVPGASYTITATSRYQGISMTPVSVTVRQI
jgi:hypothetical protein